MKRLVSILVLPVLLALGAAVLAPKLAPEARLRSEAMRILGEQTGQEPTIDGSVSFSILPWPAIEMERLSFGVSDASLIVPHVRLVLDILPLLTGRVRTDRIDLDRPQMRISVDAVSTDNWASLAGVAGIQARTMHLRVTDGSVIAQSKDSQGIFLGQLDGNFVLRGGRDVVADGQVSWRGQRVAFDLGLFQLAALAKGEAGRARIALSGAPMEFNFEGSTKLAGGLTAEGPVRLSSPRLRDLLEWIGLEAPTEEGFGAVSLRASTVLTVNDVAFRDARLEFDGNRSEGGFSVRLDKERPVIQGSFASGALDLSPYGRLAISEPNGREWSRRPIDLGFLSALDLDLRLSATQVSAGNSKIQNVAASAFLKGGKLALAVGEAAAWNGMFRASANVAPASSGSGAELRVELVGKDVDLDDSLGDLFKLDRLEGTGTFRFLLGGTGGSVSDIVANLDGSVVLNAAQGALIGVDVARVLSRLERRPLSGGGTLRGGRTDFEQLEAKATIHQGVAQVDRLTIDSSSVRIALGGKVSIADRDLDLQGTAGLVASAGAAGQAEAFDLPFVIQGPWASPFLLPDPQALIRRSGAARPLLGTGGASAIGVASPAP